MNIAFTAEVAEVLYDFDAGNLDELTLRTGVMVSDCMPYEQGWMFGELNGKRGMFPSSFVKIISQNSSLGMYIKDILNKLTMLSKPYVYKLQ